MASAILSLKSVRRPAPRWIQQLLHWFRPYDYLTEEEEKSGQTPRFRYLANAVELWGLQALMLAAVALIAPAFWHSQFQAGPWVLLATVFGLCFFVTAPWEWFFHRFGLHRLLLFRALPWLKIVPEDGARGLAKMYRRARNTVTIGCVYYLAKMTFGHGAHHKITDVTPINPSRLSELFSAINRYEITTNGQTDEAVFPHFSVVGFWVFFLPITIVMQLIANALGPVLHMPHLPIILAATISMTWQAWVYENSHAIMHKPYREWWKPRIERSLFKRWYSVVYRFHFFHHMNENCSLGVVGAVWFCYIWDRIFGTYKLARLELIESASRVTRDVLEMKTEEILMLPDARPEDFAAPPRTRPWITYLDGQASKAQDTWNGLFVAALQEVRRRRASVAMAAAA